LLSSASANSPVGKYSDSAFLGKLPTSFRVPHFFSLRFSLTRLVIFLRLESLVRNNSLSRESRTQQIVLLLLPVVGVVALRVITFIRHPPRPAESTAANTEKVMDTDLAEQKAVVTELKKYLAEATEAVNAGNFAEAKEHYNAFHDKWTTIEQDFKEKSSSNYQEMEEGMDKVKSSLINAATPDKGGVIAGLQRLTRALDDYTRTVLR